MTFNALSDLFNSLGVEYLTANRYEPAGLARREVRRTFYYRRNRSEFEALTERYGALSAGLTSYGTPAGESITGSRLPEMEVRHLGGLLGYGLFTLDAIPDGGLIGEYTGIVRPARPGQALPGGGYSSDYAWGFPKVCNLGRNLEIDAREAGGVLRFANHSNRANAFPDHFALNGRWRIVFVALRDISAGDEISVDYGEAYWASGERELVE